MRFHGPCFEHYRAGLNLFATVVSVDADTRLPN
jgi:hypothetical protein